MPGVNDSFLMVHAWLRSSWKVESREKRLGVVFEETGPSITIVCLFSSSLKLSTATNCNFSGHLQS